MDSDKQTSRLDAALAKRLQGALTARGDELFQIVLDPSPEVLRTCLKNRHLGEEHLLALLKRRDLPEDLLKAIFQMEAARESRPIKLALARNPATPGPVVQSLLPQLFFFELVSLCFLPGVTPDQKLAAERTIIQRLPTTPLGNKTTLARRGTATVVCELLKEGDPALMEACLSNPRLREVAIFQFLSSAKATAENISCIARHPKWKTRPNLRAAILKNRKTPPIWFTLFLPSANLSDIKNLLAGKNLSPGQKKLVKEEIRKRGR